MRKKSGYWLGSVLITLSVLGINGCSSAETGKSTENDLDTGTKQTQPAAGQVPAVPEPKEDTTAKKPDNKPSTSPDQPVKSPALPKHKNVEVTIEGMKETKQGTLFKSDQGYYLYTLPRFSASPEEPGKDIIIAEYDSRHTMRIERLAQDSNLDNIVQNAKEELQTLGEVQEQTDVSDPFFRKAKAYLFASDGKYTRVIIIQKMKENWFRITLNVAHAESSEGVIPSFWAMIKTVGIWKR
jgi:hypothetical protein